MLVRVAVRQRAVLKAGISLWSQLLFDVRFPFEADTEVCIFQTAGQMDQEI